MVRMIVCAAMMLCISTGALATERPGVQAVVFARWNATSVRNMTDVVNEVRPAAFELSQCPFFGDRDRWYQNTNSFLSAVNRDTRLAGTFFLSFHTDQSYSLGDRATRLSQYLAGRSADLRLDRPMDRLTWIILSPQLEDNYNDATWNSKTKEMLDRMDMSIVSSSKLSLRRSIMGQSTSLREFVYNRSGRTYRIPIVVERHSLNAPSSGAWSNDGAFIYHDATINGVREDAGSMKDNPRPEAGSLQNFASAAKSRSGVVNLFRPAYNLWRRDVANGKVSWTRDGNLPAAWNRRDSNTTFDEREKQVLKIFLRRSV